MTRTILRAVAFGVSIVWAAHAALAQTTLRMASFIPPTSPTVTHVLQPFAAAVEKETGGEVRIQEFWGGALGRDPFKQYSLVTDGVIDIGFLLPHYAAGQFPDDVLFEFPYLVRNAEEASVAKWRMFEQGLLRGYDDIKVIGVYTTSPLAIHTQRPITSVDDLRGLKIRASGRGALEYVNLIGAVPVAVPITEVAEAVSRGTIDGLMTNWDALVTFRAHHVVENHFDGLLGTVTFIVPMNKKAWEGLSPRAKAAVDKYGGETFSRAAGKVYDERDGRARDRLKAEQNRKFLTESAEDIARWQARMKPIYDKWIAATPDGQKKFDALQSILAEIRAGR